MLKLKKHIKIINVNLLLLSMLVLTSFTGCEDNGAEPQGNSTEDPVDENPNPSVFVLPNLESPEHYPGIPIYTANMGKNRSTDVYSEWVIRKSSNVSVSSEIIRNGFNALHKINFDRIENAGDYMEFVMAIHGKLVNRVPVPQAFLNNLTGIRFKAVSYDTPVNLKLEAYTIDGVLLGSETFEVNQEEMQTFEMNISSQQLHHFAFKIEGSEQDMSVFTDGAIGIDEVYLKNSSTLAFQPPADDTQFLNWLKSASLNYFIWNYREVGGGQGVVIEDAYDAGIVSLSGMGYAYAAYVIAEEDNLISSALARERILAMLKWQEAQNWSNGTQGVYGFPYHYFDLNGNGLYSGSPEAVSTIDWAMCAAGIRTVKQKYTGDSEIETLCNTLLNRPQWQQSIHDNPGDTYRYNRITKGFSSTGTKNGQVWADAFSEETEIIYLEALASGQVPSLDLNRIFRAQENGFYVSWFGSGFTYNWMQLWTGPVEPYKTNSTSAYLADASTASSEFGNLYMGLTACATISEVEPNGFVNWRNYVGNQGSSVSGATSNEVIQISPAPYGAVLALPFTPNEAIQSLRQYVELGYYHPLLGLPDNIRMKDMPNGVNVPLPNWNPYDLNIGAIFLAIEQYQQNRIAQYYLSNTNTQNALNQLIQSF
jgi:hypothetical protein